MQITLRKSNKKTAGATAEKVAAPATNKKNARRKDAHRRSGGMRLRDWAAGAAPAEDGEAAASAAACEGASDVADDAGSAKALSGTDGMVAGAASATTFAAGEDGALAAGENAAAVVASAEEAATMAASNQEGMTADAAQAPALRAQASTQPAPRGFPPGCSMAYNMPLPPAWDEVHAGEPTQTQGAAPPAIADAPAQADTITDAPTQAGTEGEKKKSSARKRRASAKPRIRCNVSQAAAGAAASAALAALSRAVALRGTQAALASAIGVTQSHVSNWFARRRIPAEHCPAIERATQRAVRCEELRPDIDWGYLRALCEAPAEPM